ncbi:MAG: hypothetical protein ACFWUE_00260 [Xylanivirga thermophila]|jgi:hypothetical protein|uniref:hypothetical protein n=1 Tax=Xylanivirga thermophila TaxID=2496273 RepID=UPI0039F54E94
MEKAILAILEKEYGEYIYIKDTVPKPYYENIEAVKAIILGCDPSTGNEKIEFDYVFNIDKFKSGKGNKNYFKPIYTNLNAIGLSLSDIYVQNLCKNYSTNVTSKNKKWTEMATLWVPAIKEELDSLFPKNIPVLLTAECLLEPLCNEYKNKKARFYYEKKIIIKESDNKLGRNLIPFFRCCKYRLDKDEWSNYKYFVKHFISRNML